MSFDDALRLTELLAALALFQRALEHLALRDWRLFLPQLMLAGLLVTGIWRGPVIWALWALGLWQLHRFQGPYNGGSDKMLLLVVSCLALAHAVPGLGQIALAYLAVQLVLSYFVSGWVKLRSADWRAGDALADVFAFSAYPVSEGLRRLGDRAGLMRAGSWAVIGFEVAFPLALLSQTTLIPALCIAAAFHLANALFFGLNRFLWAWIAAYPALLWFQDRLIPAPP